MPLWPGPSSFSLYDFAVLLVALLTLYRTDHIKHYASKVRHTSSLCAWVTGRVQLVVRWFYHKLLTRFNFIEWIATRRILPRHTSTSSVMIAVAAALCHPVEHRQTNSNINRSTCTHSPYRHTFIINVRQYLRRIITFLYRKKEKRRKRDLSRNNVKRHKLKIV